MFIFWKDTLMATIAPLESIFTIVGKSRSVILNLSRIMQFSHHHVDPKSFIFEDSSFYFPYNESEWGLEIAKSTILFLQQSIKLYGPHL